MYLFLLRRIDEETITEMKKEEQLFDDQEKDFFLTKRSIKVINDSADNTSKS